MGKQKTHIAQRASGGYHFDMPIIRKEYYGDMDAIRSVHEQAFNQSAEADLVDALRMAGKTTLSLIAEENRALVGHILFTPVTIDGCPQMLAAIGPMAVLPRMQQHGIGRLLIRTGIYVCREMGIKALVVLGYPEYYPRFGFVPASGFGLSSPWKDIPDEAFMALELEDGALDRVSGTVRYADEFDHL